jgi:hypothetical protein
VMITTTTQVLTIFLYKMEQEVTVIRTAVLMRGSE